MGFSAFSEEPLGALVEQAGSARKLSLLVGAGASMEAGLPSWETLLDRLLLRGGEEAGLIPKKEPGTRVEAVEEEHERWLTQAGRDGPLGKAALAEALSGQHRDSRIREALFGPGQGPDDYFPGPTSQQIAFLSEVFNDDLRLVTLNYDDLVEQALKRRNLSPFAIATEDHHVPDGHTGIFHLHGYLGRDGRPQGRLILSEADYMQMQDGSSWQQSLVTTALMDSTLVFVGASMLDPNVIRYLHGVKPPNAEQLHRFALFVRQGTYDSSVPTAIRSAREKALAQRWKALGVTAVYLDHFTDVAQVLFEIGQRRRLAENSVPLSERAPNWVSTVQAELLGCDDDTLFLPSQETINELLVNALRKAREVVESRLGQEWDETLQLALWLVDRTGTELTNWVMTDRLHVEPKTIEAVPISEYSRWVAVRSYCLGTPLAESRDVYASRWKFVRGTPLMIDSETFGRLPVGCLTTASMSRRGDTLLSKMRGDVLTAFNDALSDTILTLLEQPFLDE